MRLLTPIETIQLHETISAYHKDGIGRAERFANRILKVLVNYHFDKTNAIPELPELNNNDYIRPADLLPGSKR